MTALDQAAAEYQKATADLVAARGERAFFAARLREAVENEAAAGDRLRAAHEALLAVAAPPPTEDEPTVPPSESAEEGRDGTPPGPSEAACGACPKLDATLSKIHRLALGCGEAIGMLREGDQSGRVCPTCGGVEVHFGACRIRMTREVLDNALAEVACA